MKGIVFTEYLDFVEDNFGYDLVDRLITSCDLPSGGSYTSIGSYEFSELVQLLTKTSELTGKDSDYILQKFGWHLFGVFTKAYPQFFTAAKSSFDILSTLDDKIHPEVLKLYPDAELPRFEIEKMEENVLVMIYRSSRKMSDFAEGLIEASMSHFNEKGTVRTKQLDQNGEVVRFTINKTS
ncbi:heme NO-binding domain-containing protein [Reichenbachiella sp. MALMAid0571]|uniref:heme NO-binding domain-containing protein n=1 Tax=Reichenbachiella sp. MALMAid0571 TaxID=3143939 RepID=UPI0032DFFB3B